jgi:hypothetical protein
MSWIEKLHRASAELAERGVDPWQMKLEGALRNAPAMSTVCLLDLVGARPTTSNGRRLARILRPLGFVPLKSRRLEPGGFRDTSIRGWARPVREPRSQGIKVDPPDRVGKHHEERMGP